jgi:hypothetical protein
VVKIPINTLSVLERPLDKRLLLRKRSELIEFIVCLPSKNLFENALVNIQCYCFLPALVL